LKQKYRKECLIGDKFYRKLSDLLNAHPILSGDGRIIDLLKNLRSSAKTTNVGSTGVIVDKLGLWMPRILVDIDKNTVVFDRAEGFPLLPNQVPIRMGLRSRMPSVSSSSVTPAVSSSSAAILVLPLAQVLVLPLATKMLALPLSPQVLALPLVCQVIALPLSCQMIVLLQACHPNHGASLSPWRNVQTQRFCVTGLLQLSMNGKMKPQRIISLCHSTTIPTLSF